jgi:hypothetical protein
MRTSTLTQGLLIGSALLSLASLAWAQAKNAPTVEQMLNFKPMQKGIIYSTPAAADLSKCKVEFVEGPAKGNSAWVLRDPKGQMLRKFSFSAGNKYTDQWSYYKDGLEVYRELDTNLNGKADRFVWLNGGGMKIGVDKNEDGIIDAWLSMSQEELSQEVVKAVVAKDERLLDALLVTEDDLTKLGAPAKEIARIKELQKGTTTRFRQTCAKMANLNEATHWQHLETTPPSRLAADATGMKQDVLMHYRGLILCETAGKHDWIQLGEMVLVGEAWKLIDAPLPGDAEPMASNNTAETPAIASAEDVAVQQLMEKLVELDKHAPQDAGAGPNAAIVEYHLKRGDLLEQLAMKSPEKDQASWWKELADSTSNAIRHSPAKDSRAAERLTKLIGKLNKEMPGSEAAGHAAFVDMTTEYSLQMEKQLKPEELIAVQSKYHDRLQQFTSVYPKVENCADAYLELAKLYEYGPKEKEGDAKKCYELVARNFAASPQAVRANGALRRMGLEGKVWELGGPAVSLAGPAFNMDRLRGRYLVVYYWMSWNQTVPADFVKMKKLMQDHAGKLELVTINVDENQADADAFLRRAAAPGYHLFGAGGMDGPLATYYGIVVFPNLYLVGPDGKVVSRTVEVGGLEEELKKLVK